MKTKFNTIGIIGKYGGATVGDTIERLVDFLQGKGINLILEEKAATGLPPNTDITVADLDALGEQSDLAIIVGGDGTLLHTARELCDAGIPLVGINLGRLGFLVDISPNEMLNRLEEILQGEYFEEKRFLLNIKVIRDGQAIDETKAFNDIVIHKWNSVRMIEFETHINGQLVNSQRSDGMIVSTPTGSTAYALSGGGPILHPSLNAIALVPICPHTLSNRPIVIDGDSCIELTVKEGHEGHVHITMDGQTNFGLQDGDLIRISKHKQTVTLMHPKNHDQFQLLRAKLHWG